ncbi:OmpA family protein [Lacimicrobium alkaliphilum]|uniref:Cell envelope biogenesis protein OmpA n=1 Tax=Lacimicrobium alkaliphilum TaxID=1526571 RepID=A0ABQ1QXY5_9ALTE|nr:OmpA family protein [Lacimicrobium alkaliphilum]GGD51376.1 cell envelope biogenesis protein OmpA [Lacimicrobium alkaliphilum]
MKQSIIALTISALFLGGCASNSTNTQKGAGIGAVAGALLGKATGDNAKSRYVWGAAVGALAGAAIGNYMDKQEKEFREELADSGVSVHREGNELRLQLPGQITFATGSATISSRFHGVLDDVAKVLNKYEKTTLMIEGHTDNTGSAQSNQVLSEARASAVRNYLTTRQLDPRRITTVGMGQYQPLVPNTSDQNRQQNRRVALRILPNKA